MSRSALNFIESNSFKIKSPIQLSILKHLALKANSSNEVFWSQKALSRYLKYDIRTIRKWLRISFIDGILNFFGKLEGKTRRVKVYLFGKKEHCINIEIGTKVSSLNRDKNVLIRDDLTLYRKKEEEKGGADQDPTPSAPPFSLRSTEEEEMPAENPYEQCPPQGHTIIKQNQSVFDERFGKKQITIDQMYVFYQEHKKGLVSVKGFREWILNTRLSKFDDKPKSIHPQPKVFETEKPLTPEEFESSRATAAPWLESIKKKLGMRT